MSNAQFLIQDTQTSDLVMAFRIFKETQKLKTDSVENHLIKIKEMMDLKGWSGIEKEAAELLQIALFLGELDFRGVKRI